MELTKEKKFKHDYLINLLEKQNSFQKLTIERGKCIIAADAALIAAMIFNKKNFTDSLELLQPLGIMFALAFLSIIVSFVISIRFLIQNFNANMGNDSNPRSMLYIKNTPKEEYYKRIDIKLTIDELIEYTSYQLSGLNKLNMLYSRKLKRGAFFTLFGVICFTLGIIFEILCRMEFSFFVFARMGK